MKTKYLYFMCVGDELDGHIYRIDEETYNMCDNDDVMMGKDITDPPMSWSCTKEVLINEFIPLTSKHAKLLFL